jgi:hypothetical protein
MTISGVTLSSFESVIGHRDLTDKRGRELAHLIKDGRSCSLQLVQFSSCFFGRELVHHGVLCSFPSWQDSIAVKVGFERIFLLLHLDYDNRSEVFDGTFLSHMRGSYVDNLILLLGYGPHTNRRLTWMGRLKGSALVELLQVV